MNTKQLSHLRVAITGGARGIGLATARELHARGATVVIGDLDGSVATQAAAKISASVSGLPLDVADRDSFTRFIELATADGPLDVLVNNAGIMPIGHFLEESPELYERAFAVNVLGCLNGMHVALPGMLERGSGQVVNVASTAGKAPVPGGLAYCASKSAVIMLTETARVEFAGTGVDFTCVIPHFINTELTAGTTATKLIPVVEPEGVAAAIADSLLSRPKDVYVPRLVGPIVRSQPLLGRRIRDVVNRRLGAYDTFLAFDRTARSSYDQRIQATAVNTEESA